MGWECQFTSSGQGNKKKKHEGEFDRLLGTVQVIVEFETMLFQQGDGLFNLVASPRTESSNPFHTGLNDSTVSHQFAVVVRQCIRCKTMLPPRNDCNRRATDFKKLFGNLKRTAYTACILSGPSETFFSDVIHHSKEQLMMEIDTKVKHWEKMFEETCLSLVFPVFRGRHHQPVSKGQARLLLCPLM